MSTLAVVEEILRTHRTPMVVREIVQAAGERLPTRSKTPDTVVARDLAMDIKRKGAASRFARVAPGRYTLREYAGTIGLAEGSIGGPVVASAGASVGASAAAGGSSDLVTVSHLASLGAAEGPQPNG